MVEPALRPGDPAGGDGVVPSGALSFTARLAATRTHNIHMYTHTHKHTRTTTHTTPDTHPFVTDVSGGRRFAVGLQRVGEGEEEVGGGKRSLTLQCIGMRLKFVGLSIVSVLGRVSVSASTAI